MGALIWCAWVGAVLGVAHHVRPLAPPPPLGVPVRRPPRLLVAVGRVVDRALVGCLRLLGRPTTPRSDHGRLGTIGAWTLVTVAGAVISPPSCALGWLVVAVRRRMRQRRAARTRAARIAAELPDVVELLAIAISSGSNLTQAVDLTIDTVDGLVADALRATRQATGVGVRMVDALGVLPLHLGDVARPLVTTLVLAERHGTPLVQALRQLAIEMKADRRRVAEEAARRVPVRLLGPLVLLLLPAFALLTVAPLLAGGLRSLRL